MRCEAIIECLLGLKFFNAHRSPLLAFVFPPPVKARISSSASLPLAHVITMDGGGGSKSNPHNNNNNNNKVKGFTGSSPPPPFKFAASAPDYNIQRIKDDPAIILSMTVQQLKTTLRSVGIPVRGRKCDLVSALKRFLDNNHLDGDNLGEEDEQVSSVAADTISANKKAKSASEGGYTLAVNHVSQVSSAKNSMRTVLKSPSVVKNVQADAEVYTSKEKVSVVTDEDLVGKSSKSRVTISSEIEAVNLVTLPYGEPWTVLAHKKPQKGWVPYNPRTMRSPPLDRVANSVKLMSWNVNGLKAVLKLEGFSALELAQREDFDVLCLQETKLQEKDVDSIKEYLIDGYEYSFWTCSVSKLGYSGTAIVSRIKPLSVTYGLGIPEHDSEGRIVTAEFESFYLVSAYVPNSGDGLKRLSYRITQWDPALSNYVKGLEKSKPVILTGDLNCAHQEIDIYNPAGNRRSAGFTDEERQSFGTNFLSKGFVDTFRKQHPDVVAYTFWGYRYGGRKTNKGWRLDYFLVSESIAGNVHDSYIAPEVIGSDHCPIGLILKL